MHRFAEGQQGLEEESCEADSRKNQSERGSFVITAETGFLDVSWSSETRPAGTDQSRDAPDLARDGPELNNIRGGAGGAPAVFRTAAAAASVSKGLAALARRTESGQHGEPSCHTSADIFGHVVHPRLSLLIHLWRTRLQLDEIELAYIHTYTYACTYIYASADAVLAQGIGGGATAAAVAARMAARVVRVLQRRRQTDSVRERTSARMNFNFVFPVVSDVGWCTHVCEDMCPRKGERTRSGFGWIYTDVCGYYCVCAGVHANAHTHTHTRTHTHTHTHTHRSHICMYVYIHT